MLTLYSTPVHCSAVNKQSPGRHQGSPFDAEDSYEELLGHQEMTRYLLVLYGMRAPIIDPFSACMEATYHYAIKNQRKSQNNLVGTFSMTRVGSLWHKRAGVDTP